MMQGGAFQMKKLPFTLTALTIAVAFSLPAHSATLLGAKAGVDFWYADAKINNIKADDSNFQQSLYVSLEHFIPLIPNGKIRYTNVRSDKLLTNFDQYDLIAYYEILDNEMLSLDVGIDLQHYKGHFVGQNFSEWHPNLYGDVRLGIPATPVSLFGTFSYGTYEQTSTVDAEAGAIFTLDLAVADVNFKVGYRIQDYDFNYFIMPNTLVNQGFFAGVEIGI